MKNIYSVLLFVSISVSSFGQNQLQGYDPFPTIGGGGDIIYNIAFDSQDRPWVGSGFVNGPLRELAWFDGNSWTTDTAPSSIYNSFRQVEFDQNGILWMGGGAFFGSYDNGTWNVFDGISIGLPDSLFNVTGLIVDNSNNKWFIATHQPDDYLVKYDGTNFTVINIDSAINDTSNIYRNGLFKDNVGNIYLTSPHSDSIMVYDGNAFSPFNFFGISIPSGYDLRAKAFDKTNYSYWQLLADNYDSLILGHYVSGSWTYTSAYSPNFSLSFAQMTVDNTGRVWLSDGLQLVCFDGTGWQTWNLNVANYLYDLTSDNAGDVWLTCQGSMGGNTVYRFLASSAHTIQGTVWYDSNNDGIFDPLETGMSGLMVSQSYDNWSSITSTAGNYMLAYSDSNQAYTISCIPPQYWVQTFPVTPLTVTPASQPTYGINIGIAPIPGITDLQISVVGTNPRPGFTQGTQIIYCNNGTDTISDTITYIHNSQLTYFSGNPVPDVISGDTLKWAFNNLLPLVCDQISIWFHLDSLAVIGDSLFSTAYINPTVTDTNPSDNQFVFKQIVRGSFDPNEKVVYPEGDITVNDRLYYTIFFQNTGTDTAFQVILRDSLDQNLNFATLQMEGSSNQFTSSISPEGYLEFRFANILLPDSNVDEPHSHGFVRYSVMPKSNLSLNTILVNTAAIYFDFNQPVLTNTVQSTITSTVSVKEIISGDLKIWPNPASDKIVIQSLDKGNSKLTIRDLTGRIVIQKDISSKFSIIDIRDLHPGIYLVSLEGKATSLVQKLIKE